MDEQDIKDALADIERRKRVTIRCISTTIASTSEIVEEIEAGDYPSASTLATLEVDLAAAREKYQDVHSAITALLIVELKAGDVQMLEAELQNLEGMKKKLGGLARKATKAPPTAPSASYPSTPSATSSFRIQACLKPKLLLEDSRPSEFEVWKDAFRAYYENSNMDLLPVEKQRNYMNNCLGPQLVLSINPKAGRNVKLFGSAPSVISCLEDYFKRKHPIFNRRSSTLAMKQSAGQSREQFFESVARSFLDSGMTKISVDELQVHVVVAGLSDPFEGEDLREEKPHHRRSSRGLAGRGRKLSEVGQ